MLKGLLKICILVLMISGISWYVVSNWEMDVLKNISPNWNLLFISCIALSLFFLLQSYLGFLLLHGKPKVSLREFIPIFFISQLGRYIPGKIWLVVGRVELLKKKGINRDWGVFISFLEMLLLLIGASITGIGGSIFLGSPQWGLARGISVILILIAILIILNFRKCYELLQGLVKKSSFAQKIPLPQYPFDRFELQKMIVYFVTIWLIIGSGFYYLMESLIPNPPNFAYAIVVFAASWTIGFLSLLSPSGIGVRESVIIGLLSPVISPTEASIIAITSRIWFSGVELILASLIILGDLIIPKRRRQ